MRKEERAESNRIESNHAEEVKKKKTSANDDVVWCDVTQLKMRYSTSTSTSTVGHLSISQ